MARETQSETLARYRAKIEHARKWRRNAGYDDLWKRMIDLYAGKHYEGLSDTDQAVVNISFAVGNIVLASCTTQYPKFTVSPNKVGYDEPAVIAEAVLNYAWGHYPFHDHFQLAVTDFVQIGHGWLKTGWKYHEKRSTRPLSPEEQHHRAMMAGQALNNVVAMPGMELMAGDMPTDEELEAESPETVEEVEVVADDPYVERVSPFDVFVDPEAHSLLDARWIAHRVVRDIHDVREDENYDARARRRVEADSALLDSDDPDDSRTDMGEDADRVTVWEFYDLARQRWCVFAHSGEGYLRKPEPIPYEYGNPFTMFRNYEVPDHLYPMGELEVIESLQDELNKTRTQAIDARKQFVRKFIARESALTSRAKEALVSDRDGEIILIEDDNVPLREVVEHAPHLDFDPNVYNAHSSQVQLDMQVVTGLSDYQFGQMPDTRRLATEAMAVEGATNARSSFKLSRVERTLALVGRKLLICFQQFVDGKRGARIAGPGGELLFDWDASDIEGEFDLVVEAGSTQPRNDTIRRQEALSLFNTLAPFLGTLVNPTELLRYVLQTGFDVKNVDRFLIPQVPGMPPGAAQGAPPGAPPTPGGEGVMPPAAPPPDEGQGVGGSDFDPSQYIAAGMA